MPRSALPEEDLPSRLLPLRGSPDPVFILFTSTRTGTGGERWCPDCTAADPVLDEAWERAPAGAVLLEVQVTRERWKVSPGQAHPFRGEPFKVRGVPTLVVWDAKKERVTRRLADLEQLEVLTEVFAGGGAAGATAGEG